MREDQDMAGERGKRAEGNLILLLPHHVGKLGDRPRAPHRILSFEYIKKNEFKELG